MDGEFHVIVSRPIRGYLTDVVFRTIWSANGNAIAGLGMAGDLVHVMAEVYVLLTCLAETDGAVIRFREVFPKLGALKTELDGAIGDGGAHGEEKG